MKLLACTPCLKLQRQTLYYNYLVFPQQGVLWFEDLFEIPPTMSSNKICCPQKGSSANRWALLLTIFHLFWRTSWPLQCHLLRTQKTPRANTALPSQVKREPFATHLGKYRNLIKNWRLQQTFPNISFEHIAMDPYGSIFRSNHLKPY